MTSGILKAMERSGSGMGLGGAAKSQDVWVLRVLGILENGIKEREAAGAAVAQSLSGMCHSARFHP